MRRGARHPDLAPLRYAQCWEDADVLLRALDVRPEHTCLSIASGGDNTLAILSRRPRRVIAIDMNPAQIACLELRVAAYRTLAHRELLELVGSLPSSRREDLYRRCRPLLAAQSRSFWDSQPAAVQRGIGEAGNFERYLALFRTRILPCMHPAGHVERLLRGATPEERQEFYRREWDTRRWRLLFRIFFSRFVMARIGRDPSYFRHARGSLSEHLLKSTRRALTALNPAENPYLQWILTGRHLSAFPYALRAENFEAIRSNLDRLEWHCCSVEKFLGMARGEKIDRYNLSDIFEYMSQDDHQKVLECLVESARSGARLAYWNMLVERRRPPSMASRLKPLQELSDRLQGEDKVFFYSAFIAEEVV